MHTLIYCDQIHVQYMYKCQYGYRQNLGAHKINYVTINFYGGQGGGGRVGIDCMYTSYRIVIQVLTLNDHVIEHVIVCSFDLFMTSIRKQY